MWEDLIRKAKHGGLDVIDTYVFWDVHEPSPGNVIFMNPLENKFYFLCFIFLSDYGLHCSTILKEDMI